MKKIILIMAVFISLLTARESKIIVEEINSVEVQIGQLKTELDYSNNTSIKKDILREISEKEDSAIELIDELTQNSRQPL